MSGAVRLAKRLMPADGDLSGLLANLARHRGRGIHVLTQEFGGQPTSGLWLATERADYLVVDGPTTPSRHAAIICHEVAHILLGHEAQEGAPSSSLPLLAAPDLSPELVARAMARHSYADEIEADAEQTATLIGAEHWTRQINSSRLL